MKRPTSPSWAKASFLGWNQVPARPGRDATTGRVRDRDQDLVVSERTVAEAFGRLAGPDGLTAQPSTFARQEVIAALGAELAGATRTQMEQLADRFLSERAVAVVAERVLEERRWSTPELLAVEHAWSPPRWTALPSRPPWPATRRCGRRRRPTPPPALIRPGWSATSAAAARAWPWWSAGRGPARPSPWGSQGMPGSWTATDCSRRLRPGSPPSVWKPKGSKRSPPAIGCCLTWRT